MKSVFPFLKTLATRPWARMSVTLPVCAILLAAAVLPVQASAQSLSVSVLAIEPGRQVEVQIANLPSNDTFTVTMGPAGSQGVSTSTLAHFDSGVGGTKVFKYEVLTDLQSASSIDIRVDDRNGVYGYATFQDVKARDELVFNPPTTSATDPSLITRVQPIIGAGPLQVVHVEQGGIVQVALIGVPQNTDLSVFVNTAGLKGLGYQVGTVNVGSAPSTIATFEIPVTVRNSEALKVTISGPGFSGSSIFDNTTY